MKKIGLFLLLALSLVSCATPGGVMGVSDEVVVSTEALPQNESQLVFDAFYCDNTECNPRGGRWVTQPLYAGRVGCPTWMDITIGTKRLTPGSALTIPEVKQFFVDANSCVVRVAQDDEFTTTSEFILAILIALLGFAVVIVGLTSLAKPDKSDLLGFLIAVFGLVIMFSCLFIV